MYSSDFVSRHYIFIYSHLLCSLPSFMTFHLMSFHGSLSFISFRFCLCNRLSYFITFHIMSFSSSISCMHQLDFAHLFICHLISLHFISFHSLHLLHVASIVSFIVFIRSCISFMPLLHFMHVMHMFVHSHI